MFESVVYSVEFQKRGLPHAHTVLFLHRDYKIPHPSDIIKSQQRFQIGRRMKKFTT